MNKEYINFDQASTLVLPTEINKALFLSGEQYRFNPSSSHRAGKKSFEVIEKTRVLFLNSLGLEETHDLFFIPSATVGNNLALQWAVQNWANLQVFGCDHPSIVEPARNLFKNIQWLSLGEAPNNSKGSFFSGSLTQSFTGAELDIKIFENFSKNSLHLDLAQAFGKKPINLQPVAKMLASFSLSAHKIGGPVGVAAIGIKKGLTQPSLIYGGGQESQLWSGTLAAQAIFTWAEAFRLAEEQRKIFERKSRPELEKLFIELKENFGQVVVEFFEGYKSKPFIFLLGFKKIPSDMVMRFLETEGVLVATSTACSSKSKNLPKEFRFLGVDRCYGKGLLRLSFSPWQGPEEIREGVQKLFGVLKRLSN